MAATKICLWANALAFPRGGGHLWVYLNWALGLRAIGCEVTWLEGVWPAAPIEQTIDLVAQLRARLQRYGPRRATRALLARRESAPPLRYRARRRA